MRETGSMNGSTTGRGREGSTNNPLNFTDAKSLNICTLGKIATPSTHMHTSAAYRELIRLVGEAEGVERVAGVQCVLTVRHVAGRRLLEPEPFGQEH